jgi:uncharacterized SAM-dependent methyltransferase
MSAQLTVLPSQFPDQLCEKEIRSLRERRIANQQHYQSAKQVQKWIALHKAYSPFSTKNDCQVLYNACFDAACRGLRTDCVHLVGLGSGDGAKEHQFIRILKENGRNVFFSPVDVGLAMVLKAREKALKEIPAGQCIPIICDVGNEPGLLGALDESLRGSRRELNEFTRIFTFFGMLPGFAPSEILPRLHALLRGEECALLSANLIPPLGRKVMQEQILPLYDNELTRAWLLTYFQDLGVNTTDGEVTFAVEEDECELEVSRISAYFKFNQGCEIRLDDEVAARFSGGDVIRLFRSYRYTLGQLQATLLRYGFQVQRCWATKHQDEAILVVGRSSAQN